MIGCPLTPDGPAFKAISAGRLLSLASSSLNIGTNASSSFLNDSTLSCLPAPLLNGKTSLPISVKYCTGSVPKIAFDDVDSYSPFAALSPDTFIVGLALPLSAAFRVGDELLVRSIIGVTELLTTDGLVNLDFEDLKAVIQSGAGVAMIGLGNATGDDRADVATLEALHSPLLEIDTTDARGALINVVGGPNLSLGEAERCAQIIKEQISEHAKIIWGAAIDESLNDEIRVMLVLTGVKSNQIHGASENRQLRALRNRQIEFVN